jgi:hypothetical protein
MQTELEKSGQATTCAKAPRPLKTYVVRADVAETLVIRHWDRAAALTCETGC